MIDYAAERDLIKIEPGGVAHFTGFTDTEVRLLIEAATGPLERLTAGQAAQIADLAGRLGTSNGIIQAVLATLGENIEAVPMEALPAKVAELAKEREELRARQAERQTDPDAAFAAFDRALPEALAAGDDAKAEALLRERRDLRLAAAARRAEAAARLHDAELRDLAAAAEDEAALGELALTRLRYREAAAHFRAAADLLPDDEDHRDGRLAYRDLAAEALYRQGSEFGDNAALGEAIAACRAALEERTRERAPLGWATTQNNLGAALSTLGERESGTARLEEATEACRAALEERTRERAPLDWAMTQNNLGNALSTLGARESGAARLEQAVGAYRAALVERTRERVPLDWAMTKANMAIALATIAERLGQPRDEALAEIDAALEVFRAAGAAAYVEQAEGIRARIIGR